MRAHAELARGLDGDRGVVAGDHLDAARPWHSPSSIVALESSRGGSNIGRMPSSDQVCPPSSERATRQRARALGRERVDGRLDPLRDVGCGLREVDNCLRRALGDDETFAPGRR